MIQVGAKPVSKRISVSRTKDELVIYVSQGIERWQEALLIAWLSAWLFCGCVFIYNMMMATTDGNRIFFIIASALWLFFFVRITKVFIWRRIGCEIISLRTGQLAIKNAFGRMGKNQIFYIRNIFKFGVIKVKPTNFFAFLDNSFWVMGGDTIGFSYSGQKIQFGKQLDVNEMNLLARMVEQGLREFKES